MRKPIAGLTALEVASLGPGDHVADANGLVLRVRASGARSWAVRYSIGLTVGSKPAMTQSPSRDSNATR